MNNLLERLHASFFFYIMTGPQRFLKIGFFLPSAILISVAMMFHGLSTWVNAAWINEETISEPTEKENSLSSSTPPSIKWRSRRRPVISVLGIMISTHFLGSLLFWTITRSWFMEKYEVSLLLLSLFMGLTRHIVPVLDSLPSFIHHSHRNSLSFSRCSESSHL